MNKMARSCYWRRLFITLLPILFVFLLIHAGTTARAFAGEAASVEIDTDGIAVTAATSGVTFMMLRIASPWGDMISEQSTGGDPIRWSPPEGAEDGLYTWEVRVGFSDRKTTRDKSPEPAERTRPWQQSGTVQVKGGAILPPADQETGFLENMFSVASATLGRLMDFLVPPAYADQVFTDDVIVQYSLGVGVDSYNGQDFGFDTIRLRENNLRIHFDDTSSSAGFPNNDWRIILNDSASGGAGYFAVEDSTAGRVPFRIRAGAWANALYISEYGRIGMGTATPLMPLHIVYGNTPTVRLDQDGTWGWPAQAWDVGGHEGNFFIRDVTNGYRLPFRIQPGTPDNLLCLKKDDTGRVGIGTWSPQAKLHVEGNVFVLGNLEVGSSREYKENIQTLQAGEAMNTLRELRPVRFHYKTDPDEESIGFISEEVPDLVATNSRKSMNAMDVVAVLAKVAQEQQKVIEQLSCKIADLEKELKAVSRSQSTGNAL